MDASRRAVDDSNAAIKSAQQRFDTFAASTYVNGPSSSYLTAADPSDILDTASVGQTLAASAQQVVANLQRARTEQVNKESAARLAKQKADQAAVDAQASQDAAVSALTSAQQTFRDQQGELDQLTAERNSRPGQARRGPHVVRIGERTAETRCTPVEPVHETGIAHPRHPRTRTGGRQLGRQPVGSDSARDPERVRQRRSDRDHQLGARHLVHLGAVHRRHGPQLPAQDGNPADADRLHDNGAIPRVYGRQASEYVIQRAGSQMGVPYSWGGGNAAGKSNGIESGAGTVGFDCSGLILYAFAGVGIKLPHYSGAQYDLGRKIPSSQMRRGDVIFYGPGGSQHVTLYLGNNQMLEAPYTGLARQGVAGADQRHDPVRRPVHRILMRVISVNLMRHNTLRCVESRSCRCWRRWPC